MLPNTFRQLEYIQSSGTQYINTGVTQKSTTTFDISVLGTNQDCRYLGAWRDSPNRGFTVASLNSKWRALQSSGFYLTSYSSLVKTRIYNELNTNNWYFDGNVYNTGLGSIQDADLPIYAFACNYGGTIQYASSGARIYYLKLYDNGTLVRDFVPARRKSDSVLGLYDLANDVFYTNNGSGSFIGGSDVYSVTASVSPSGGGSVTGGDEYVSGASATLTATPNTNYQFDKFVLNGYTKLDYIESNGTQYIDTELHIPYANIGYDLDFAWTEQPSSTGRMMFGVRDTINAGAYAYNVILSITGDSYNYDGYCYTSWATWGQSKATGSHLLGMEYNQRGAISFRNTDGILHKADGTSETLSQRTISTLTTYSPYIFAVNENGSPFLNNAKAKLYSAKIYNNDTLVRDYIPVKRTSDNAVGLLDLVNLKFYGNDGTGTFSYGSEVGEVELPTYTELDYIESSGTQYIDTGYVFNTNCEYSIKLSFTSIPSDLYAYGLYSPHTSLSNYGSSFMTSFGGQNIIFTSEIGAVQTNTIYEITRNSSSATVNGVTKTGTSGTISTSKTFWLFRANSLAQSYAGNQKLYSFKLYDNGTLVRDFVPVKRNSDSAIGLLDLVNLKFYANNGTGSFTYGSEVGALPITSFTITEDVDVTANFSLIGTYYKVTVTVNGSGVVSGSGQYLEDTQCTLVATPHNSNGFIEYKENETTISTNPSYMFVVTNDTNIEAFFTGIFSNIKSKGNKIK